MYITYTYTYTDIYTIKSLWHKTPIDITAYNIQTIV